MSADKPKRGDIVTLAGKQWRITRAHKSLPLHRGPYRLDLESTTTGNIIRDLASCDVQAVE